MAETPHSGVVREWRDDEGWGLVDCDDLPAPCWVHFSVVRMEGLRRLVPGARVALSVERIEQDGYQFRASSVTPGE
jgi:CspA family cold shock protein